jgi:hypothetical protein
MSLSRFMLCNFARKKFITNVTNKYYMKGKDSLNSVQTRMLKKNSLEQLLPHYYNYTIRRGSRFIDFCVNRKEQYEIIPSQYVLNEESYNGGKRTRISIKMYRIVFDSVINAMVFYDTLKSALKSRDFLDDFKKTG